MPASSRDPFFLYLAGLSLSALSALVLTMAPTTQRDADREEQDA